MRIIPKDNDKKIYPADKKNCIEMVNLDFEANKKNS